MGEKRKRGVRKERDERKRWRGDESEQRGSKGRDMRGEERRGE